MHDYREPQQQSGRRRLSLRLSRRQLFALPRDQLQAEDERSQANAVYRLVDLGRVDDSVLRGLIPQILPETRIWVADDWVWARSPEGVGAHRLFEIHSSELRAFNLINGRRDLEEAGMLLSAETGCSDAEGWRTVKEVFLSLVERRVCVPV